MPHSQRRQALLARIPALRRRAHDLLGVFTADGHIAEVRAAIATLHEAEAWLRGAPPPEVVTHVARMVEGVTEKLYQVVRDIDRGSGARALTSGPEA